MSKGYVITIPADALYALRINYANGDISYYQTPYASVEILQDGTFFASYDTASVHMAILTEIQEQTPTPDFMEDFTVDVITVFGETMNQKEKLK